MSNTDSSAASTSIESFTPNVHARVRSSAGRTDRLRSFLQGHLPPGVDIEVVLTPAVQTAAVLPADVDALVSSDATELERRQAAQLLEGVDAEFLVLITTAPAPLDRVPLNDQLTADHAHQFGLAFHELLHILKTAIVPIAALLDAEVDSEYHRYVHELINIVEDGAIEKEAIHGANFSDTAEIRLELTRRIHSQTPDDLGDGQQARLSFWDAVTTALYDATVYPTGTTGVLLDEADSRVGFVTEADETAFRTVRDALDQLAADALTIRGIDLEDATHTHDKTASVERARRVIDTWTSTLQPIVAGTVEPTKDSQRNEETASGNGGHDCSPPKDDPAETPGAADVSLHHEETENPYQDVFDHPAVTPDPDIDDEDRENLETLATEITGRVEIRLEHEAQYDWVAFVPQRESDAGALTKYFGKVAGDDEFKVRGIEARQRSTPPFIEEVQRDCLDRLDETRSPDAVLDRLQDAIDRLHAGTVPVEQLVERNRVSKPLEGYTQNTQNVAALKRARDQDLGVHPGQDIEYVVVDDEKSSRDRVALAHETIETYDADYYETQLVRAVESVLSPLGWDRADIRRELAETREVNLADFTAAWNDE